MRKGDNRRRKKMENEIMMDIVATTSLTEFNAATHSKIHIILWKFEAGSDI